MQIIVNITKENEGPREFNEGRQYHTAKDLNGFGAKMRALLLPAFLLCLFLPGAIVFAQDKPKTASSQDNPLSAWNKRAQAQVKDWLLRSAEKMPEENYGFKPADAVRSYGQIVGHVADMQYIFCSSVLGEKNPAPRVEKTKTTKAELIAALKEAFGYCDKAYDSLTDATAGQTVKHYGNDMPKLFLLSTNVAHTALHYGNLVTYMRLKNIVPPSSDRSNVIEPKK